MSHTDCEHARGLIAMNAVGVLGDEERVGLLAHLDGCRQCRQEDRELRELAEVLPTADLDRLDEQSAPPTLSRAVLGKLAEDARRDRRFRHLFYLAAGAVAASVTALGLVFGLSTSTTNTTTVALSGAAGVHASVTLTAESWGTAVHVTEAGQSGGQVLWVWMRTNSGKWWEAGTFQSVSGRTVQVDLACAIRLVTVESVWVRGADGHVLVHGYVT